MIDVSIVIPTHNRQALLPTAVESGRKAFTGSVEIVIVDDASTDATPEVSQSLPNVRYLRHSENRGLAAARNTGAAKSSGRHIVFLDDDDELLKGGLDAGVGRLDAEPAAGFFYGQVQVKKQDGSISSEPFPGRAPERDVFWECVGGFGPCPLAALVRRTAFDAVGGFDERLNHFEDLDLWTRLSEKFEVLASMDVVGIYREARPGSGQLSSRTSLRAGLGVAQQARWLQLPRSLAAPLAQRERARQQFLDRTSDLLLFAADAALDEGLKDHARANILTALRLHPRRALRPGTLKLLGRSIG